MSIPKPDLILHPVRLRIIQAFSERQLTPRQLADALPDVPQATLYRQINKLAKAGILVVMSERPVRGTLEKVYAIPGQAASLTDRDLAKVSREDQMRYFTTFVASLLGDFWRYLQQDNIDLGKDGIGYRQIALNLNDKEFGEFSGALKNMLQRYRLNKPGFGRRRRILSTIIMPSVDEPIPEPPEEASYGNPNH